MPAGRKALRAKGKRRRAARRGGRHRNDEQYRDLIREGRRGRRRKLLTTWQRIALRTLLERRPSWRLADLRRVIPGLPRNSAAAYVRRCRRVRAKRRRRRLRRLQWLLPGAVWAIDGTWLDVPVEGSGRRALVVVELHSKQTLTLASVPGERADAAEQVLAALIARHGTPLVLKADNGSAFIAKRLARFCRSHDITLMHSPVRRPRFNGCCEVSGKHAKRRAQAAAAQRGAASSLSQADLCAATTFAGEMPRVSEDLRGDFLQALAEQRRLVAAERGLVLGPGLGNAIHRSLGRVAAQRALLQCHILSITGRDYLQCLSPSVA